MKVVSLNISTEKGIPKESVEIVTLNNLGIVGDAHCGSWHRQVSLLARESIDRFNELSDRLIRPGEFAENITTSGIDLTRVSVLDRLEIGEVELEVTQIGKKCHGDGCSIYQEVGKCVMPKEGIFARVLRGGSIKCNDAIAYNPKPLSILIVTASDRAYRGEYQDRSGPKIKEMLNGFFKDRSWHPEISAKLVPDDADLLRSLLESSKSEEFDIIFTTGGTGIGPRDFTVEVVTSVCDKFIPGIMEQIRIKFGSANPQALLSRSVAGTMGNSLIFTLPGSVKAVTEYLGEIFKILEHSILMVNGIGH